MTAFPKETTAKDIGAVPGDRFRSLYTGNILTFDGHDGNVHPRFVDKDGGKLWLPWYNLEPLEPRTPAWETLQEGDVLESDHHKHHLIVQGVIGKVVFHLYGDEGTVEYSTIDQLKKNNWKIKGIEPAPKKMTVSEVSKALGYDVEIVEG